ncbi:MAG: HAMP domain-containing histidine kinase [Frankiaceae bacterium]|nr:HAMP domain-containing histidine kinase [Frankiaceae bacterium]
MSASPAPWIAWWRRHAGVRITTSLTAAGVVAAALAVSGVLLAFLLQRSLTTAVEDAALQRARDVAATVARDGVEQVGQLSGSTERNLVQVVLSDRIVTSSPDIEGEPALTSLRPAPGQIRTATGRIAVGEEEQHVIVALGVRSPDAAPAVVVVAQSLESVDASISALRALLLAGVPLLVLLVGGTTFVLAGRALRPVEAIRQRVAGIDAEQLGKRVPVPSAQDEVGRLAATMNDMLDRLESSAAAQRRFVSDASHELRSPLATVRTSMEVAQVHPELTVWPKLTQVVLDETARLQTLVADMLLLARSDERGVPLRRTDVDLDDLCEQEVARLRSTGLRVLTDVHPARTVGDADALARALRNLVNNAARHAATVVTLSLRIEGSTAVLEVGDDGPGIPPDQRRRVFERFVRLDESRTRTSGGTGLGLPIVQQIVHAHAGSVSFVDGELGGAHARVVLPLPPE